MAKQDLSTELPVPSVSIQPWKLESIEESTVRANHYALLDACNEPAVLGMAEVHSDVDCLYQGQSAEDFSAIAPYLFNLDLPLLAWFKDQLIEKTMWRVFRIAARSVEFEDALASVAQGGGSQ